MASKRNRKLRLINIVLFWSVRVLTACKNNKTLTFTACKNERLNNTPREKKTFVILKTVLNSPVDLTFLA